MLLLDDSIRTYAWGQVDGLAALVGSAPTGGPEAELWVGTHPSAPSRLVDDPTITLAEAIAAAPERLLGAETARAFHGRLPYLLKVLAIGAPLSLQAHPSAAQALAGYEREDAAGIGLDAPQRTYRDRSAKPELLVALVDTWALCGFRDPTDAGRLVDELDLPVLAGLSDALDRPGADGTRAAMGWLLGLPAAEAASVAGAVGAAADGAGLGDRDDPRSWVARLAREHPGDAACIAPLLLNLLHLRPGEAVHLPAGNLHAYLEGAGVELMASSDNVLRGGLTPKHVDVDELMTILRFEPGLPHAVRAERLAPGVTAYDPGERAFALTAIAPSEAGAPVVLTEAGPALLLATGGTATVRCDAERLELAGGRAAFVAAGEGALEISGSGTVWRATAGLAPLR